MNQIRMRTRHMRGAVLLAMVVGLGGPVLAGEAAPPKGPATPSVNKLAVDMQVDVTLSTGETLPNVKIARITPGRVEGSIVSIALADEEGGRPRPLLAARIQEISLPGGRALLVFDSARKVLVPPDAVLKRRTTAQPKEKEPESDDKPKPAEAARPRGSWPELTDQQQREAVEKQRAALPGMVAKIGHYGMKLYETKRFLFYSDLPPAMVSTVYVPQLDQMYTRLCAAYGVEPSVNIWLGKATLIAFADGRNFHNFEENVLNNTTTSKNATGIAHSYGTGNVLITCYFGGDPKGLASVMVHETAHGFNHRFRSPRRLPSWLNEGIAVWISRLVVYPDSMVARRRTDPSVELVRSTRSLGAEFFTAEHIEAPQYGVAASMIDFLLKYNANPAPEPVRRGSKTRSKQADTPCFRKFLEGIKDGASWEEALKESYGLTRVELAQAYGQAIGIPNLQP